MNQWVLAEMTRDDAEIERVTTNENTFQQSRFSTLTAHVDWL